MNTELEYEAFSNLTDIQSFFFGQSVFITGVTGLVGKTVLEKILRSCPGIGRVYIHMRPKKGLTSQQRLDKFLNLELFREVKKVFPEFQKNLQIVDGDMTKDRLGLSLEDFDQICQNVSIVIHSAASINFNDPIKYAVENNVIPVQTILNMCHEMTHIKALIHVSTAYVKREEDGNALEKIPKIKVDPEELLTALQWMDIKCQNAVEEFLLENNMGQITTYLITKAMAEILLERNRGNLPVAVVRPCYVSPIWKEPIPGWIEHIQGLSGLLFAGAKGLIRTLQSVEEMKVNIIPIDIVANTIIASAWKIGTTKPVDILIVNCTMDYNSLPLAEEKLLGVVMEKRDKYPLANMFRYPDFVLYHNSFAYYMHALIDQWIPALIIDLFLFIFTGKTILVRAYIKIAHLYGIFYTVCKYPWIHQLNNYKALESKLSAEDAKIFYMNLDDFDWEDYIDRCLQGGRKFIAKEDPSNIPYAKKKALIWWTVTTILKWFLILYLLHYFFSASIFIPLYISMKEKYSP